ncbi:MAG: hypothetical protein SGPRY_008458 [Prymnesium sp.]
MMGGQGLYTFEPGHNWINTTNGGNHWLAATSPEPPPHLADSVTPPAHVPFSPEKTSNGSQDQQLHWWYSPQSYAILPDEHKYEVMRLLVRASFVLSRRPRTPFVCRWSTASMNC